MPAEKIRLRERDSIIQSLRTGVTPKVGIHHIQVGRANEIKALCEDTERIIEGGAAFRLIIGEYGSGKTFFLSVVRAIALQQNLVTVTADLSPDRRVHATQGQARKLYSELMRNLATRNKPEGNAITSVVELFITRAMQKAESQDKVVTEVIQEELHRLTQFVGGFSFAKVIEAYWNGHESDNNELKKNAIRWLRAEYTTRTDARNDLGVRDIISDASLYDTLKLLSLFVRQAGYEGLLVNLDEMVNLYKLNSRQARQSNYEQILRILNDCLQGAAEHIGFLLGGTPEFLFDTRRGLYSYEALQSRLAANAFAQQAGVIDYSSPVLHLANLTPEELYVLLSKLRHVFASGDQDRYLVPDEALESFLEHCRQKIGEAYFRTPRNTIKTFLDMLAVLDQNPDIRWDQLIGEIEVQKDRVSDIPEAESSSENEMTNFTI